MSQQDPSAAPQDDRPKGDPWHAFGYVVSGVAIYGFLGWLLDQWLGTSFLVAVGILIGAGLGIYLTFKRFNSAEPPAPPHDPK
ncbi:MAG: AtpZ/AtpI family protein [Nocardioides sp.]